MVITVFGATGMVGKQIVKQALYNGDKVNAFGRNVFTADFSENENLALIKGALFDEEDVYSALKDSDAVISVLGGATDGSDLTRSYGMKVISSQMERVGIERIVALAGIGILPVDEETMLMDQKTFPQEFLPLSREHFKAFEVLNHSNLDWTLVCPPMINDAPPSGIFNTMANALPTPNRFSIYSGDLALFMLKELKDRKYRKQRVGISN